MSMHICAGLYVCVCAYRQSHDYVCMYVCIYTKPWICMYTYEAMGKYRAVHANAPVCIAGAWECVWGGASCHGCHVY